MGSGTVAITNRIAVPRPAGTVQRALRARHPRPREGAYKHESDERQAAFAQCNLSQPRRAAAADRTSHVTLRQYELGTEGVGGLDSLPLRPACSVLETDVASPEAWTVAAIAA
jgi:hypothetical protein